MLPINGRRLPLTLYSKNEFPSMQTNLSDSIRASLRDLVSSQIQIDSDSSIQETTLIRNGAYCGRRFSFLGYSLVWFQEENQVKLYSPSGELLESSTPHDFCSARNQPATHLLRDAA